jgi:hypothetical protein
MTETCVILPHPLAQFPRQKPSRSIRESVPDTFVFAEVEAIGSVFLVRLLHPLLLTGRPALSMSTFSVLF